MPIKPITLEYFYNRGKNVYESIVVASRRARQINEEQKIEFNQRIETIVGRTEVEGEEMDVDPDQLRISLEFEKRPKPSDTSLEELIVDGIDWRYKEKELPPPVVEEESSEEAEED